MNKFFTADTHFGHDKIAHTRGFTDAKQHDDCIIDLINMHVGRNDQLFILGDFSLPKPQKYRLRIKCRQVKMVMGNHDRHQATIDTFGEVPQILITKVAGVSTVLCHYPIAFWPSSHHGSYHLYGHTHANREVTLDGAFPGRRSIDVGVDNAKRLFNDYIPFNEQWIHNTLNSRGSHDHIAYYDSKR